MCITYIYKEGTMEQTYLPGTVRDRIQDLLKERKISQVELASKINMSESALSRFLSGRTDKIGDENILKIAEFLGVSTDFILGQTDFPERRNYDIGELGLSYKAAMALYTRQVDTDVVNRILENPQFPAITRMISRYFDDTFAQAFAEHNAMLDMLQNFAASSDLGELKNGQAASETVTQLIDTQRISVYETDIEKIQVAVMNMLRDIKNGIQTQVPTSDLATKQIMQSMIQKMTKGENEAPGIRPIQIDQLSGAYSVLTGATPELGKEFSGLVRDFISGYMKIAQKQGLMPEGENGFANQ